MTSRIVHLALRVPDAEEAARFYQSAFGLEEACRLEVKNLTAIHLSDGAIYFTMVQYHSDATAESRVGSDPCVHHMGIEVEDCDDVLRILKAHDCTFISPPEELPVKFLTPEGILLEFAPAGYFRERLHEPD